MRPTATAREAMIGLVEGALANAGHHPLTWTRGMSVVLAPYPVAHRASYSTRLSNGTLTLVGDVYAPFNLEVGRFGRPWVECL